MKKKQFYVGRCSKCSKIYSYKDRCYCKEDEYKPKPSAEPIDEDVMEILNIMSGTSPWRGML
jgi:hypothetical protein